MSVPTPTAGLIAEIAAGNTSAFEALFRRYEPRFRAFSRKLLGNAAEADDAVQDAFVKVWLNAGQFDSNQDGEGWLYSIVRHTAIDRFRTRKRVYLPVDDIVGLADQRPGPEVTAIVNNDNQVLHGFLDKLAPHKAAAVRGAYLNGESYKELATRHGVPLNTMRTWLRTSLIRLRRDLHDAEKAGL